MLSAFLIAPFMPRGAGVSTSFAPTYKVLRLYYGSIKALLRCIRGAGVSSSVAPTYEVLFLCY